MNCSSSSINFIGDMEYNTPLERDCQLLFSIFLFSIGRLRNHWTNQHLQAKKYCMKFVPRSIFPSFLSSVLFDCPFPCFFHKETGFEMDTTSEIAVRKGQDQTLCVFFIFAADGIRSVLGPAVTADHLFLHFHIFRLHPVQTRILHRYHSS